MEPWGIALIVAGGTLLFGITLIVWGKKEEKKYYDSLSSKADLREFMVKWPPRPQPGALKTGGWIAVILSLILGATSLIIYFS